MSGLRNGNVELALPLDAIDRTALPVAGDKAVNLGELIRAGLLVPYGFCVTTAAYELVAGDAGLDSTLSALAKTGPDDTLRSTRENGTGRKIATRRSPHRSWWSLT